MKGRWTKMNLKGRIVGYERKEGKQYIKIELKEKSDVIPFNSSCEVKIKKGDD